MSFTGFIGALAATIFIKNTKVGVFDQNKL
jgi:hypothetical protein